MSLWEEADGILNQLHGICTKNTKKSLNIDVKTFSDVLSRSSYDIEHTCSRITHFGQKLHSAAKRSICDYLTVMVYFNDEESLHKCIVLKLKNP